MDVVARDVLIWSRHLGARRSRRRPQYGQPHLVEGLRRVDVNAAGRLRCLAPVIFTRLINATHSAISSRVSRERRPVHALYLERRQGWNLQKLHVRAGDAGDIVSSPMVSDPIDASAVDTALMGHSYFCENRIIVRTCSADHDGQEAPHRGSAETARRPRERR